MSFMESVTVGILCLESSLSYFARVDIAYLLFYCVAVLITDSDAFKNANYTIPERPRGRIWSSGDRG